MPQLRTHPALGATPIATLPFHKGQAHPQLAPYAGATTQGAGQ